MKSLSLLLLLPLLAAAGCTSHPAVESSVASDRSPSPPVTVLDNLTVIDMVGSEPRPGMAILVRGDRIAEVYPAGSRAAPPGARVINLAGRYALPGLIDGHVHLTAPFVRTGQQDSLSEFFLRGGITAIRDMAGNGAVLRERSAAARSGTSLSPRIFYSTLVASVNHFATDRRVAALTTSGTAGELDWGRSLASESDAVLAANGALAIGASGIKAYAELTPEMIGAVVREADKRGVKVWSHAALFPARPSDLVKAGVDVLSHSFMLVFETYPVLPTEYVAATDLYDFAGHPASAPEFHQLLQLMKERGSMLDPSLYAALRLGRGQRVQEGDLQALRGIEGWANQISRLAHRAGVKIVAGTDMSGYPGRDALPTIHDELQIYVDSLGMTPLEALQTATVNGAEAVGASGELGSIAAGKLADLLILDANPLDDIANTRRIHAVVKGGVVHPVSGTTTGASDSLRWAPSWPGTQLAVVRGTRMGPAPLRSASGCRPGTGSIRIRIPSMPRSR